MGPISDGKPIEEGGIEWSPNYEVKRPCRAGLCDGRGDPDFSVEFDQAREMLAVAGLHQALAAIGENAEVGPFAARCFD